MQNFRQQQKIVTRRLYRDEVSDGTHWKKSIVINAVGAVATFTVLSVFIATKFIHGAWIVVVVIPVLVFMFRGIHDHYVGVAKQLSTDGA